MKELEAKRERLVYSSPWWSTYDDELTRKDGTTGTYTWARTTSGRGAVMVVPRMASGDYVMIKVHRYPVDEYLWEFVAGLIDEGETPEETAVREIEEEIGIRPTSVSLLGRYTPVSGFIADWFYSLVAEMPDIELDDLSLQTGEGIVEARIVAPAGLRQMTVNGEIKDGVTLTQVAHLWAHGALD